MTDPNLIATKKMPDGSTCALYRFIFTTGLLVNYNPDEMSEMYTGRYCYQSHRDALDALEAWDGQGDPPGRWIKYKGRGGERSNPNLED